MLIGVVSWHPPFFSNWKVKSKDSELENGRRFTTGTGTSVWILREASWPGHQRNGTQKRVVDPYLHARNGANGNGVVAVSQPQDRRWAVPSRRCPEECGSRRSAAPSRRPATGRRWHSPTTQWSGRCAPSAAPHRAAACPAVGGCRWSPARPAACRYAGPRPAPPAASGRSRRRQSPVILL